MKTRKVFLAGTPLGSGRQFALHIIMLAWVSSRLVAADDVFPTLQLAGETLSNVIVLNRTRTDIFIQHAGGLSNYKLAELNPAVLRQLGLEAPPQAQKRKSIVSTLKPSLPIAAREPESVPEVKVPDVPRLFPRPSSPTSASPIAQALLEKCKARIPSKLPVLSPTIWIGVLLLGLLGYLFFCYCSKLIVEKTGNEAGLLIWLPLLQTIPLLRAAGMSNFWFLLMFIPGVSLIGSLVWCFKIVEARGKSVFWAIMLLLPGTSVIAFLYLAFSDGPGEGAVATLAKAA